MPPDLWYTDLITEQNQAAEICRHCPVRANCILRALNTIEGHHGMWAGFSERKLRSIRKIYFSHTLVTRRQERMRAVSPWTLQTLDEWARQGIGWPV